MHITVGRAVLFFVGRGFWALFYLRKGAALVGAGRGYCCCFTGHRRVPAQDMLAVRQRLRREIARLAGDEGVRDFLAGGAVGFDTLAAQEVVEAREEIPGLRLVLVLPCMGQESRWPQREAAVYRTLLRQADEILYTAEVYQRGCMFQRNRYLVDHSAYCLCYLRDTARGGTAYTVRYARQQGLQVINLAGRALEESQVSLFTQGPPGVL